MTCIVGYTDGEVVFLGADSLGGSAHRYNIYKTPKLGDIKFRRNEMPDVVVIFGYTSSYRMGDILRTYDPGKLYPEGDVEGWIIKEFIPSLRGQFKSAGFAKVDSNVESGGDFLLGICGKLFAVQEDFSVLQTEHGYDAVGSGIDHAMGAMHALLPSVKDETMSPQQFLDLALRAAEAHVPTVRGPFHFIGEKSK